MSIINMTLVLMSSYEYEINVLFFKTDIDLQAP